MRYIPIDELIDVMGKEEFEKWVSEANNHLENIRALTKKERAVYLDRNNHWSLLYPHLSKLSGHKCWYSEAPESSSEWEIDHYRPKNKSTAMDGSVILEEGYWWLAYYWKNYRLAGSLVNKRRKDRFEKGEDVYGKGCFFPLNTSAGTLAQVGDIECNCEVPVLIDPIRPRDVTLLSFDKDGDVFPTYGKEDNEWNYIRSEVSIEYYGLKHTPLKRGRSKVWGNCEAIVNRTYLQLQCLASDSTNNYLKQKYTDDCYYELAQLSKASKPYSMVIRSFVEEKIKEPDYFWLKEVIRVLQ